MNANGQRSSTRDRDFEDLNFLAATICQVPVSLILIETEGRNTLKAILGVDDDIAFSEESLSKFLDLSTEEISLISDVSVDGRFGFDPVIIGGVQVVFFAGISLPTASGSSVRLCLFDQKPRNLSDSQLESLKKIARQVTGTVESEEIQRELSHLRDTYLDTKKLLHKIIDAAEVGIWEWSLDTDEFRYSERWARILGYSVEELGEIAKQRRDALIHPADLLESEKALEDYRSGIFTRYECELRMKHKNGYWVWMLERGELLTDTADFSGQWLVVTVEDNSEQVIANEQIYVREKRFQILLENSEDAISILSETGKPHFETESVSKILGYSARESSKTTLRDLVHPEDLENFDRWFQQSIQKPSQPIKGNISRMRHSDGTWRYISGTLTNLLHDPIIRGLINNFKDVTEQVRVEELRQRTENKYRKLAQEGADLVSVLSPQGAYLYLSPNFSSFVGFSDEELEGMGAFYLIHPDDTERILDDFRNLLTAKNVRTAPFRVRYQREDWRWVQSVATNLLDDPDIQGIVVNSVDVTEVIEAQKALERSNERFRLVLKAGSESIYDYDPVSRTIFFSEPLEETFGIQVDKLEGDFRLIYDRIHPEDLNRTIREFREAFENPEISIWTTEYRLLKSDGTYAFVRDRAIKEMDAAGKVIRVVGALRDVSRINFFQKLLEIEKEFIESTLAAGINEVDLYKNYLINLESLIPGMRSSLSRVVEGRLSNPISPSLPQALLETMENLPIGPNQGSCGTAAYLNEKVFVTDVFHDVRWEHHHEVARTYGIGACWSFPIVNSDGKVVATIANYYSTSKEVEEKELQALERAHRLISLLMAQFDYLEKIRLSNERYQLVNKTTNEAIFDWDVQNDRFYWGESLTRVFGHEYSADEFNLEKWTSLMHPADEREMAEEWTKFFADKNAHKWKNQFRFLRSDGSFAFVEESAYLIRDRKGEPLRMIGVLRDSTEMKKMEVMLANASKLSRVGGWEIDVPNDRLSWSPITCEIHEVPADFVANIKDGIAFYREDHRERVSSAVASAIARGEKYDLEAPIITAKGEERWVRSIGEAEFSNGQAIRIFGSVQDIQERKLMEERLKGVSDSIPGVIFQYILKPDGAEEFRYVSKGSIPLLGLSPEECMADSQRVWSQVAQGGEIDRVRKSLDESAKSLNFWSCEWKVLTPQGKIRWREGLGTPVRKVDGSVVWDALIMDVTERKNLENLLEQSASMAMIGSWEMDMSRDPLRLNWSATSRAILGLGEVSGTVMEVVLDKFVGDSREVAKMSLQQLIQNGTGFDVELELDLGNGSPKWIRCIGQAQEVKGKIVSAVGSLQDIHDRKLSELNLKSLLLERNKILESIGDGFFAVDRQFTVTYWNQQAEKLLNIPRENILGRNLWEVLGGQKWNNFYDKFHQALDTGTVVHFEECLEEFNSWFSISAFPSVAGLTVYFKDITENKNAQEEIRKSNDRFERVSEATNDAIWDYQISDGRMYWGKGFETKFGYKLDAIIPSRQLSIDLIHPQDRNRVVATFRKAGKNPNINYWHAEYRFKKADGTFAYVIDRVVFSRNADGQAVRVTGAISDITERKEFEVSLKKLNISLKRQAKELAVSNAELEQFAYVASHDLQEPLRMVSSFLSQLDRKYRDQLDDKAQRYIHFAVDGAMRMRQIILDLLEYSRVGKEEKVLEVVNLEEVIFEVTQLQSRLIEEKGARILFEGHSTLISFKSPILQVFQNLIGNALKYSKEGVPPVISIACREENDHWKFAVKDNGIGIREEYFDKVFVIFQRLHAKQEYTGTGLGLAIVRKIVESLGGRIWLESVFGEGTTFHFTISKPTK